MNKNKFNAVRVRFKRNILDHKHGDRIVKSWLGQKVYTFRLPKDQRTDLIKKNSILFVKDNRGRKAPVVVEELIYVPEEEWKMLAPTLQVKSILYFEEDTNKKKRKK